MNSAHNQPYSYIVTIKDLDGVRTVPYLFETFALDKFTIGNVNLAKGVKTFRGNDDYRFLTYADYYAKNCYDDVQADKQGRIIVKSTTKKIFQKIYYLKKI